MSSVVHSGLLAATFNSAAAEVIKNLFFSDALSLSGVCAVCVCGVCYRMCCVWVPEWHVCVVCPVACGVGVGP